MARKDLSRTVIEGGRYYRNSWERRASHGIARARTRMWLAGRDLDGAPRAAPKVGKSFRDKLGPAKRWLEAQVGRPWSKVFSELCARFDTRTIAGRHVVHDHMLRWVRRNGELTWWSQSDLFVDAHGILRRDPWAGRSWQKLRAEAAALARGRRAALTERGWWWFKLEGVGDRCPPSPYCSARHHEIDGGRYHRARYLWSSPMTEGERRRLDRMHPQLRDRIVIAREQLVLDR